MIRLSPRAIWIVLLALACRERGGAKHVFQAPPPPGVPAGSAAPATTGMQSTGSAEAPLGAAGPEAKILAFADAATGAPVSMNGLTDGVDVLTVVATGPDVRGHGAARVRLELRGAKDTMLVLALDRPAPSIVAHAFRLHCASRATDAGLPPGNYSMRVILGARDGHEIAASVPMFLTVAKPRG